MNGKELAELAMQFPDFEFEFAFIDNQRKGFTLRGFKEIKLVDVGYSDKVIFLSGKEK